MKGKVFGYLADALTLLRLGIALVVLYLGKVRGADALPQVIVLVALAWVTDGLDGPLARRSPVPTRLGRYEFLMDVMLTWTTFAYLTLAGFIPWVLALLYTGLALLVIALVQRKSVIVAFMRPIDLTSGLIALRHAPEITLLFLVWLVGLGLIHWRRTKNRIATWLRDLLSLVRRPRRGEAGRRGP